MEVSREPRDGCDAPFDPHDEQDPVIAEGKTDHGENQMLKLQQDDGDPWRCPFGKEVDIDMEIKLDPDGHT